jgi:hypothetical protein
VPGKKNGEVLRMRVFFLFTGNIRRKLIYNQIFKLDPMEVFCSSERDRQPNRIGVPGEKIDAVLSGYLFATSPQIDL